MKNFSSSSIYLCGEERRIANEDQDDEEEEEEEEARCEWDISLSALVSSTSTIGTSSDALGAIEFDPTGNIIATGGIARKIRFYSLSNLLHPRDGITNDTAIHDHVNACQNCICTPAKLSSLKWRPGTGGRVVGAADYDGVVTEYDLETRVPIFERDEHGGRRVWSVDYTHASGVSGSDDGTAQLWDIRDNGKSVATVKPSRVAVCSVEFDPFGGQTLAIGCADRRAYVYDIRRLDDPAVVFEGHAKAVTYARFLDTQTVITASTDGCLKLWETNGKRVERTYRGHLNSRNFVGLSIWRHGGLIGCGSENNNVFVYDKRWGEPIWVQGSEPGVVDGDRRFISSVCWKQVEEDRCTLVAGGSDGFLQIFMGERKRL